VALFAISTESLETSKAYAQSLGVDYPLLSDSDRKVAEAYGVASPGVASGVARWTIYIGVDGKILYIDKQVLPTNHGRAIAAKLSELGVPKRARR
jgi:thioredoxin-dependent peroxiredoxin